MSMLFMDSYLGRRGARLARREKGECREHLTDEQRQVYRVLTTDRRDFGVIRIGPRFTRTLELLP